MPADRSRVEQRTGPPVAVTHELAALVQPVLAVDPELYALRRQAKAGPVRRPGHGAVGRLRPQLIDARDIGLAGVERTRLVRSRRAKARIRMARGEVGVRLLRPHFLEWSFDADLPPQRFPVEQQRRPGIGADFLTLAALDVGVEHEAIRSPTFEQHHTYRWRPI